MVNSQLMHFVVSVHVVLHQLFQSMEQFTQKLLCHAGKRGDPDIADLRFSA